MSKNTYLNTHVYVYNTFIDPSMLKAAWRHHRLHRQVIQFGLTMVRATQRWSIREREPIGVRVGVHSGAVVFFPRKVDFHGILHDFAHISLGRYPQNVP